MIKLTEEMSETLEALWRLEEAGQDRLEDLTRIAAAQAGSGALAALRQERLIEVSGGRVRLLHEGRETAGRIIRRHRLAERLICDVLGSRVEDSEDAACEFEHLVEAGVTNSICTLLGHPRYCPHNRPIPEGECCRQAREELTSIVVSCDMLEAGASARIAYIASREHARLLRLGALGLSPGAEIRLLQKWPSYVLQCEETEIALEKEVARCIYVWSDQRSGGPAKRSPAG